MQLPWWGDRKYSFHWDTRSPTAAPSSFCDITGVRWEVISLREKPNFPLSLRLWIKQKQSCFSHLSCLGCREILPFRGMVFPRTKGIISHLELEGGKGWERGFLSLIMNLEHPSPVRSPGHQRVRPDHCLILLSININSYSNFKMTLSCLELTLLITVCKLDRASSVVQW